MVRSAFVVDVSWTKSNVKPGNSQSRMQPARARLEAARQFSWFVPRDLPPDHAGLGIDQRSWNFWRINQPLQAALNRGSIIFARHFLEGKQGHRSHGILMDRVDRKAFHHLPGPDVIMPPPLTLSALQFTHALSTALRDVQRVRVVCCTVVGC